MDEKTIKEQDAPLRYQYLIEQVAKNREIWLLQSKEGMFAMFEDNNSQSYIPVWPSESLASEFITDDWEDYETGSMKFFEFTNWMKELKNDEIMIAAFPDNSLQIIPLDPFEIKKHLEEEQERNSEKKDPM